MNMKQLHAIFVRTMYVMVIAAMVFSATGKVSAEEPSPWRDEFDGPLADGWYWWGIDNMDNRGFNDGFLRIDASSLPTGGENLLLRSVTAGDFSIETRLLFTPDTNFQFAGLVIWQDESNFLQLGRAFCKYEGAPCVGSGIYFDYTGNSTNFATQIENPFDPAEAYLRLERRGEMVRAFYSHEGITWTEIGTHWIPPEFQVNGVGLTNSQNFYSASGNSAYFDYFEMTEGWGFLPEGFHDGDAGDVPSWACNANGWAVDPDDRAADIAVEIDVDGTALPDWLYADEYREDLDNAGVCDNGNCGFSTPLWETISSYETHSVVAYAQDIESGEWVQLYNSPKELTCRTYDIYAYDPLTSETKQISNIRDADEYNPSWSPNGKKIVHDAVHPDGSYGVYITDVKTGVSALLVDGGNDAVWSPNGKWIAFDFGAWTENPDLYLMPPEGGTPALIRNNAVSADWAPNGKRIVFQDINDGSVRTIAVDGGKGDETTVVPFGFNPVWSPDGNWVAYDVDGDIWKVQVDIHGIPLGDPIQVTSGPFNDGQPTWSSDSATIVYHTGFNDDWDLWSVPATGGKPTWLTGAVVFGDYDPSYAKNSPIVGYASFSPNGQAARTWVAAFTYDAGTWDAGTHTYQFWAEGAPSGDERSVDVSIDNSLYDGTVLMRPGTLRARAGDGCINIDAINPNQRTQFHVGWTFDGAYADALTYYENLMAQIAWDGGTPVDLVQHEIFPFTAPLDWWGFVCTFTAGPPAMQLRVNYGHDWVESFYEAGHEVKVTVTESDGVTVKATATVWTESKDFWGGESGFQTQSANEPWSPAPPDIQPYDWVYAEVDNGATAQVQIGDISGTIDLESDSIEGTVAASWYSEEVGIECHSWGAPLPYEIMKYDTVQPNAEDTYSCAWDPETEWDVQPWQDIGVGYFTPDGHWVANAFRDERWMAFWTYDPSVGLFEVGNHSYYYEWAYTAPEPGSGTSGPLMLTVAGDPPSIYDGLALIGPWGLDYPGNFRPQLAWTGSTCEGISMLHPDQPMRFIWGWVNDYSMTYDEALAHFSSFTIEVFWDSFSDGNTDGSAPLATMSELIPFTGQDARFEYLCKLTKLP